MTSNLLNELSDESDNKENSERIRNLFNEAYDRIEEQNETIREFELIMDKIRELVNN